MKRRNEGQLVDVAAGFAGIATPLCSWTVPPGHALWLPPGTAHEIRRPKRAAPRRFSIAPTVASQLPEAPFVFAISSLLREAIAKYLSLLDAGPDEAPSSAPRRRLQGVINDEIMAAKPAPWFLPLPREGRLAEVTRALLRDPADGRRLEEFSQTAGASPRSLARLFVAHTGLTFGTWRQRLRLLTAMTLLEDGVPVTTVAYKTGFASPSAFIAAFKRSTGSPPGQYFRQE